MKSIIFFGQVKKSYSQPDETYCKEAESTVITTDKKKKERIKFKNICDIIFIVLIVILAVLFVFWVLDDHYSLTTKYNHEVISHVHEQVHLSLGVEVNSMVITWLTLTDLAYDSLTPIVRYGEDESKLNKNVIGITKSFFDLSKTIKRFVHKVELKNLKPNTRYFYQVGDTKTWSKTFNFKNLDINKNVKACSFSDMDSTVNYTILTLQSHIRNNKCDVLVHIGDIAYNLFDNKGKVGDKFMKDIEIIAAYTPYMVIVGNHDLEGDSYEHYNNIFNMPYDKAHIIDDDHFYSYTFGNVYYITLNTQVYVRQFGFNKNIIIRQFRWLEQKLKYINKIRDKKSWIVIYIHHPIYCCKSCHTICDKHVNKDLKDGDNYDFPGLEKILYDNKVDLVVAGHIHAYVRGYPVYNYTMETFNKNYYYNPKAPTQIITGVGGSKRFHPQSIILNKDNFPYAATK
uniref:Purple acid phosphatase n=1 Tax=Parastrongyloides trichosuri TaxID=131310 RepID=A0A0N4Z850_PARTI